MFGMFPEWFQIFFGSMIPWIESRYIIPYALWEFNWELWQVFPLAILGNMLPIPFVLLFFKFVEKFLRRFQFWTKVMDWLFKRTRERADGKIIKYEYLGLIMFVAVPLPIYGRLDGFINRVSFRFEIL